LVVNIDPLATGYLAAVLISNVMRWHSNSITFQWKQIAFTQFMRVLTRERTVR
jgi:hypothetical protein